MTVSGPDQSRVLAHDRPNIPPFDPDAAGVVGRGGPKGWLLRFAQRRGWKSVGRTLQVQQRYGELRGNDLAASVTLQAFLAVFPLVLVGIAIMGYLRSGSNDFSARVVNNLGLHGAAATQMREALDTAARSRKVTSVIGIAGLLWAGLGFTGALRLALNRAWQVPDRGWKDKPVGLLWIVGAAVLFVAGAAATASVRWLPGWAWPVSLVVAWLVGAGFFLWTSHLLPNVDVGWRALVPGAVVGATGLLALQVVGAVFVPRSVASASALWGALGVVFAVLAWLLFFGRLIVYTAVTDVVLYEARRGTVVSVVEIPNHDRATREANRSGTTRPDAPAAQDADLVPVAIPREKKSGEEGFSTRENG